MRFVLWCLYWPSGLQKLSWVQLWLWEMWCLRSSWRMWCLQMLCWAERLWSLLWMWRISLLNVNKILLQSCLVASLASHRKFEKTKDCWDWKVVERTRKDLDQWMVPSKVDLVSEGMREKIERIFRRIISNIPQTRNIRKTTKPEKPNPTGPIVFFHWTITDTHRTRLLQYTYPICDSVQNGGPQNIICSQHWEPH